MLRGESSLLPAWLRPWGNARPSPGTAEGLESSLESVPLRCVYKQMSQAVESNRRKSVPEFTRSSGSLLFPSVNLADSLVAAALAYSPSSPGTMPLNKFWALKR